MPIYEYRCVPCDRDFEALIRGRDDAARCPTCGAADVAKRFSAPAAARAAGGSLPMPSLPMGGGCGMGGCGSGGCSIG